MATPPSPLWIALSLLPCAPRTLQKSLDLCAGDPAAALRQLGKPHLLDEARRLLPRLAAAGIQALTRGAADYPALLREIHDPPPALFVRGNLVQDDDPAVAVVGSRHATPYGLAVARRLARDLADAGVTVVSGLARGIDAAAHGGALASTSGRVLAVMGCGLDRVYPPEHQRLAAAVAERGALISEFPPGTPPLARHFPRRNRIISGLVRGVVVVEAASGSGSLITARLALEQGREVYAVPGPVTAPGSHGTHELLRQGARLAATAMDVVAEFPVSAQRTIATRLEARRRQPPPDLNAAASTVWALLDTADAKEVDQLAQECALSVPSLVSALLELELRGLARALPGPRYIRGG